MNRLSLADRTQIIRLLVEGNSLRAISRITDTSINTVTKLLIDVGKACQKFHNEKVVNISAKKVQCDEIWSFVFSKQKNVPKNKHGIGDAWTWVGIDADTKLVISWLVGNRDRDAADTFMKDVAYRLESRVQLTTDGLLYYLEAVEKAFVGNVDYGQIVKTFSGKNISNEKRYSPAECIAIETVNMFGFPDKKYISTSYVERQNLTMRMHMRRFTRLTNAFSKKMENHCYAIALHFVYYNFSRIHTTLRVTPAMEAGLSKEVMEIEDIVRLCDRK